MNISYKPEEDKLTVWQTMPLKRPRAQTKNVMMLHHHSWITGEHSRLKKFLLKHSIQRDRKKWLPWKNNCAAQWQFSKRPKNITKTTRETIWFVYSRFQRLSHLTLDNKSELLDYGYFIQDMFYKWMFRTVKSLTKTKFILPFFSYLQNLQPLHS